MRVLLAALLLLPLGAAADSHDSPVTYANARFGYTIRYPADIFASEPEAENGDGRTFHARHGDARFLVWGSYNALNQSPAEIADEASAACLHRPATYRIARANLVAVSCETPDGIFYRKTLIHGDVLTSFEMTYPSGQRPRWDRILTKISGSLRAAP